MNIGGHAFILSILLLLVPGCPGGGLNLQVDDDTVDDDDIADDDTTDDDNYALQFDGESRGLTEDTTATNLGDEFTVELWFKRNGTMQGNLLDARTSDGAWNDGNWTLYEDDSENDYLAFFFVSEEGSEWFRAFDINSLGLGWHHLAIVRSQSGLVSMYLDGSLEASETLAPIIWDTPSPLSVGHRHGDNPGVLRDGLLDEIRLSPVARYTTTFEPERRFEADGDTSLLWHFDEGEGGTATDEVTGLVLELTEPQWVSGE